MAEELHAGALYGAGARALQDLFDSRRLADRLDRVTVHALLTEGDRNLIAQQSFFLLATVSADGWPDVSYKGGAPGFVRVLDDRTLCFPSYDGNGMFRSLGNVVDDGRVALLFLDPTRRRRLRVHGLAEVDASDDACAEFPGAQAVIRVRVVRAFPNCGRYIHDFGTGRLSPYVPAAGYEPPVPEWKTMPQFAPVLPGRPPAAPR